MTETFKVAHLNVQGRDVILAYVNSSVGMMPQSERQHILSQLQASAKGAGMRGDVALVWDAVGRVGSFGPTAWASYLQSLTLDYLAAAINRELVIRL